MTKLPRGLSGGEVVKALKKAGFYTKRQRGSHIVMSVDTETLSHVLDAAGLSIEDFTDLLK
ncbi:MAG: type II toxin-antitoxin system HicA family toxin [Chloroflexi bacterium]|nr:type II toxin-antitoxin system HicA family toxin [Chloroflexota bacterium]